MKLPFDFGVKLIFRLLLPGLIMALGLFPILNTVLAWGGWSGKVEYIFPILAIVVGWLFLVSDMHIYMLFEGRRYWPKFLLTCFYSKETKRLQRIQKAIKDYLQSKESSATPPSTEVYQRYRESYVEQRNFMMNEKGEFEVQRPTRLGNLIKAYEEYPHRVYRMDAVFYWPRLWLRLPKDTREELDSQQAVVDSTVYTSFALFCNAFLWLVYAILSSVQTLFINNSETRLPPTRVTVFEYLPNWLVSWLLFLGLTVLGYWVYRISIHLHSTYGDQFKSLFDNYQKDVDVIPIIKDVSDLTGFSWVLNFNRRDQLEVARNYLEYSLVECPRCRNFIPVGDAKNHQCS
jgi:hypothetical protein